MSSRAVRLGARVAIEPYLWNETEPEPRPFPAIAVAPLPPPSVSPAPPVDSAVVEREGFAQGFVQGERAGAEASAARAEQVLKRLAQTVEELQALRVDILRKTERQVVQLAIAMARRIMHREISLDGDLLSAMARVALDRMGDAAAATIRLHPEDYAATVARGQAPPEDGAVRVVADTAVRRGGCLVQSDFGLIDMSVDAQIQELATALLGPDAEAQPLQPEACLVR